MNNKLSKKMIEAIRNMKSYGDYELWELLNWNTWQPINRQLGTSSIRTDTMKALIDRGFVKEHYDKNRLLWKFTAILIKKDFEEGE